VTLLFVRLDAVYNRDGVIAFECTSTAPPDVHPFAIADSA
jgi:hypothetical protein